MAASRALVLPSFIEGIPVVLMEAMAVGRPVISTFVGGIPELVENGVHGWLVPAGSVDALAAALERVLTAPPAELEQIGRAGAERVRLQHDAATEARRLLRLMAAETVGVESIQSRCATEPTCPRRGNAR